MYLVNAGVCFISTRVSLLAMCDEFSVNSLEESRSLGEQRGIVGRLIEAAHEKDEEGKMKRHRRMEILLIGFIRRSERERERRRLFL